MKPSVLAACALLVGAASAYQGLGSDEVLMACRPSADGNLACRVLEQQQPRELDAVVQPASLAAAPSQLFIDPGTFQIATQIYDLIRGFLASKKNCGNFVTNEGIPVDYCVRRHDKPFRLKSVYSATVTVIGKVASNRDLGGSDTKSAEGAIKHAIDNWIRMHAQ